jgi:hypothetical protein
MVELAAVVDYIEFKGYYRLSQLRVRLWLALAELWERSILRIPHRRLMVVMGDIHRSMG